MDRTVNTTSFFFLFQALNGERIPKNQKDKAHFISKYEGRKNGGIPCFAEERSVERAAKVFLFSYLSSTWLIQ